MSERIDVQKAIQAMQQGAQVKRMGITYRLSFADPRKHRRILCRTSGGPLHWSDWGNFNDFREGFCDNETFRVQP